jgi:hypothetical protein
LIPSAQSFAASVENFERDLLRMMMATGASISTKVVMKLIEAGLPRTRVMVMRTMRAI